MVIIKITLIKVLYMFDEFYFKKMLYIDIGINFHDSSF